MSVATVSKREITIPVGSKRRRGSTKLANALAVELLNYGIVPDQELLDRIASHKKNDARGFCDEILKMFTIGDINRPLFPDWEDRTFFSFGEVCVQIFGYMLVLSGNDLYEPEFMENLKKNVSFDGRQRLKLAKDDKALKRFQTLVSSNVALDKKSLSDLITLAVSYHSQAPCQIRSAEARVAVVLGAVTSGVSLYQAMDKVGFGPVDVLRYAAAMVPDNQEGIKLPSDVRYANLSWSARTELMSYLNNISFDDLCEAMGNNRSAWGRFFRHFHVFQQPEFRRRFTKVVSAAFVSVGSKMEGIPKGLVCDFVKKNSKFYDITEAGNLAYRTFASRVQKAVNENDFDAFEAEVGNKPGYLFRNLGSLSNVCTKKTESRFVELVRSMIDKPKTSVLLSLVQIDTAAKYRIIDSKGNTTVTEADYSPVITEIQGLAEREIFRRHGFEGQVKVSKSLRPKIVPFLSTNAELDRGTRVPFNHTAYLYFLMHWVQRAGRRTDLDHSYVCINEAWEAETVYFGRQANSYIKQSGDITNAPAPHGGTEYGRIDLRRVTEDVRYIVPIINVYSGDVFAECETAYAGFMFSNDSEFSLQRDHVRYDLCQPANSNVPFVIDVKKRELIIVDFNNRERNGMTAHASIGEIRKIISALKTKKFMTMERFAKLLSGDRDEVSLSITPRGKGAGKIAPGNLVQVVS